MLTEGKSDDILDIFRSLVLFKFNIKLFCNKKLLTILIQSINDTFSDELAIKGSSIYNLISSATI